MATYREGYAALVAGDFTTARAKLGVVAETAVDPELRGAARELARLADELGARQARLVFGAVGRTSFVATTTSSSFISNKCIRFTLLSCSLFNISFTRLSISITRQFIHKRFFSG